MSGTQRAAQLALLSAFSVSLLTTAALAQGGPGHSGVPVADEEQVEARQRYTRGLQLVAEGNYPAALIEMQRAYALSPSYKIQYNLGQIQSHLGDAAAAVGSYERYLSEGGADVPAPRATEVSQEIAKLRTRIGSVDLSVKGEGAEVLVDDAMVGRSPFSKRILLNIGKHRFTAARAGAEPITRAIAIAGQDVLALEREVVGPAASRVEPTIQPSSSLPPRASSKSKPWGEDHAPHPSSVLVQEPNLEPQSRASRGTRLVWLGWTITGALAAGAVVTGLVASRESSDLSHLRDTPGTSRRALDSKETSTFRAALATDVLMGTAAIAAGFSLYYTLLPGKTAAESRSHTTAGVRMSIGPTGVQVRRAF